MRRSSRGKLPAGMLFVPSIKGVSHHWAEDTSEADIVLGCQTLADAAEEIALKRLTGSSRKLPRTPLGDVKHFRDPAALLARP